MNFRFKTLVISLSSCWFYLLIAAAGAQTSSGVSAEGWNGTWLAQGTLFSVAVTVQDTAFQVDEVQSLGFVWTSQPGNVNGTEATVEVSYAGATALLLARLTGDWTDLSSMNTGKPRKT